MLSSQVPSKLKTLIAVVVVGRIVMVLAAGASLQALAAAALLACLAMGAFVSRKSGWALALRWWLYFSGGVGVLVALFTRMSYASELAIVAWSALALYTAWYMRSAEVRALFKRGEQAAAIDGGELKVD
jgi:hypothetical protein